MTRRSNFARRATMLIVAAGFSFHPGSMTWAADRQRPSMESSVELPAAQAPAKFFTINDVLAKLDRERGRGPGAVRLAALAPTTPVATDAEFEPAPAEPKSQEPFGLFTFRAAESTLWRKWRAVEADIAKDRSVLERCRTDMSGCPSNAAQFIRLIDAVRSKSGRAQLSEVNQGVNAAIRYVSDLAQFGELDRWSSPLATFATTKGDCEDYAIAKYVALREAGFAPNNLKILLVRDRSVRMDHAVLAARLEERWLILDNRWSELREDSSSLNLAPLFAIGESGVQLFATPYAKLRSLGSEISTAPAAAVELIPAPIESASTESSSLLSVQDLPL
ncbi:MAG TPA: transglutaminase-like cysteine peptidase [Bradyrhizobium sp.]|nr:transglutaminase-like cysteine peptidase [Bradyrhizobium sp.]